MNCENAIRSILLMNSNELPDEKRIELEQHLKQCAECRRYMDEYEQLLEKTRQCLAGGEPSSDTIFGIRQMAAASLDAKKSSLKKPGRIIEMDGMAYRYMGLLRPVLAAAAVLVVFLGLWFFVADHGSDQQQVAVVSSSDEVSLPAEAAVPDMENAEDTPTVSQDTDLIAGDDLFRIRVLPDETDDFTSLDRTIMLLDGIAI